jgi:regulatory protein
VHFGNEVVLPGAITAIKVQKKDKARVSVYIDGEYRFSLDASLVSRLQVGQQLTESDIEQLSQNDQGQRAYRRALHMLSRRPHSEQEIREKLARKGVPEPAQDKAVEQLVTAGLVDDDAFARAWIENRLSFRPRSARVLMLELTSKGVSKEIIVQALQDYDEVSAARKAALSGWRRYRHLSPETAHRRLSGYLERRGFGYAVIKDLLHELTVDGFQFEGESEVMT